MLTRASMLLVLACTVAHAQEGSPPAADEGQALFDRCEKAWMEAAGLSVSATAEFAAPEEKRFDGSKLAVELYAASGSAALRAEGTMGGEFGGSQIIVDHERAGRARWRSATEKPKLTVTGVDAQRAENIRRAAFRGALFLVSRDFDPNGFAVSACRLATPEGDEGRELRHLTYELRIDKRDEVAHVDLWIDADGYPRRRTVKVPNHVGGPVVTLTETYEVKVGEVPAERFALPPAPAEPPTQPVDPPK